MAIKNAAHQKLIQQIVGLVVVAVIAIAYFGYTAINNAKRAQQNNKPTAPLTTTFDVEAIDRIKTNSTYPDVSPKSFELGKTDPFAQ